MAPRKKKDQAKSGLVRMSKPGEKDIEVNPLVVDNHKALGWKVVDEAQAEEAASEESGESTNDEGEE